MKTRSSSPPVHVHIPDSTSVHVHLKKSPQRSQQAKVSSLRSTASVKVRAPWVPPGKSSTRRQYKWEGSTRCSEITPGLSSSSPPLRLTDLSSEEEDPGGAINKYERKIEYLMSEVDCLKNEVKLRQAEEHLKHQSQQLSACQHLIDQHEERLEEASKSLRRSKRENTDLRSSADGTPGEPGEIRSDAGPLHQELETLLRKLVEAEIDGQAAAKQVVLLKESVGKLKKEKKQSKVNSDQLGRQHELLEQKLDKFVETNRTLRRLLREQHGRETDALKMTDEREILMRKLADSEAERRKLETKLSRREREANQMAENLETEKEHMKATGELSKVLESTRSRLQNNLLKKEAENKRQEAQIQRLEDTLQHQQEEVQGLLEQMRELKQHCEGDVHKQVLEEHRKQAEKSVNTAAQLSAQLMEKEAQLTEALSSAEELQQRFSKQSREKSQLELQITTLNNRLSELSDQLCSCEQKSCAEREGLLNRLHFLTSENTSTKLENQRLKSTLSAAEDRLCLSQAEVQQLKVSLKDFESLVEGYKSQLQKTHLESEQWRLRLEMMEEAAESERVEVDREMEHGRKQLQARMKEMEKLREALKLLEDELRETKENRIIQDRRNTEHSCALAELRTKVEQQSSKIESLQEKNLFLLEENMQLKRSTESIERKMEDTSAQNKDLLQLVSKREETIKSCQQHLEEKSRECECLFRQLEQSRVEAQRQGEQSLERLISKERSTQSRMLDLESQLSLAKNELSQTRRSKDDMEKRFQCKLQDMKNQLEQVNSSNRSLQNYVNYLKASYADVFGDSSLTSALNPHI